MNAAEADRGLLLRGVSVRRGQTEILRGVDWRVVAGQHWVVLGANGSGKSSLFQVLTGYLSATRGTIEVLGERHGRADWRELRKRVGLVSSAAHALLPATERGLELVLSGPEAQLGFWGERDATRVSRARELLVAGGISHLEKRPWRVLSQGERQRLLILRALMAKPELLILDEPCAGLDPASREHLLGFVAEQLMAASTLAAGAPTVVLATHHVEEILPGFTHVLVLRQGEVLAAGPRREVLRSATLEAAFGVPVELSQHEERYQLRVGTRPQRLL